jgi:NRAMP (natural resistance-associated macrophage protein)-like metal ion transporter
VARAKPRAQPRPKSDPALEKVEHVTGRPVNRPRSRDELVKGRQTRSAATGSPPAGQSAASSIDLRHPGSLLQILGPGLVTGASDDDPSGIGTFSQVGSQTGLALLWTSLFTVPLMIAVQELCARIALQTGVGLGVALKRKFPVWLVTLLVLALFVANTINIGADLGAIGAGLGLLTGGVVPSVLLVAAAALTLCGLQLFTSYELIFKVFKYLTLVLFAYVITAVIVHPDIRSVLTATVVPHIEGSPAFIAALVAILGTSISPYLFFWQASSEVDEMKASGQRTRQQRRNVSRAELKAARVDIVVGMIFSQLVMFCIVLTNASVLHDHGLTGVKTAQEAAKALEPLAGRFAFLLFAVGLIGTGMLAVPILAGSAAYAIKEVAGIRGNLAVRMRYAPTFYAVIVLALGLGVVMNAVGVDPIRALFVTAVINGIVAPPLLLCIVLLGSDRKIMKERVAGTLSRVVTWAAVVVMSAAVAGLALTTWGPLAS